MCTTRLLRIGGPCGTLHRAISTNAQSHPSVCLVEPLHQLCDLETNLNRPLLGPIQWTDVCSGECRKSCPLPRRERGEGESMRLVLYLSDRVRFLPVPSHPHIPRSTGSKRDSQKNRPQLSRAAILFICSSHSAVH
jgi:hypothetical protein